MTFKKRLGVLLIALLIALGVGAVEATPAFAAFSCPGNTYCIWDQQGGIGTDAANRYYWGGEWNGQCVPIGPSWNDRAGSGKNNWINSGNWKMVVYEDAGCVGGVVSKYTLFQGYMLPSQQMDFTGYWNNKASSFRLTIGSV